MSSSDRLDELRATVQTHGWAIRHVTDNNQPAFSYTIGLTALGHPELVMDGLPFEAAHGFLNLIGEDIRNGNTFVAGSITRALTDGPGRIAFIDVDDTSEMTGVADMYGQINALQAIWCDSRGNLPWEAGYRNSSSVQSFWGPLPHTFVDAETDGDGSHGQ